MEMCDSLDQFYSVQSAIFVQIMHVEIVELQLFGGHVGCGIDFSIQMLLDVTETAKGLAKREAR